MPSPQEMALRAEVRLAIDLSIQNVGRPLPFDRFTDNDLIVRAMAQLDVLDLGINDIRHLVAMFTSIDYRHFRDLRLYPFRSAMVAAMASKDATDAESDAVAQIVRDVGTHVPMGPDVIATVAEVGTVHLMTTLVGRDAAHRYPDALLQMYQAGHDRDVLAGFAESARFPADSYYTHMQ